jgi:hypothetical protein
MKKKEKFIHKFVTMALDCSSKALPIVGEVGDLINKIIDSIYENVRSYRFDKKVAIINTVLNLKTISFEDLDLEISRAAINITNRKK